MYKHDVAVATFPVASTGLEAEDDYAEESEDRQAGALLSATEQPSPARLMSLPPSVLWLIARRMGRRSRALSRALLDAYGPLDCRLELSGSSALSELRRMLGGSAGRLRQVKSLQLLNLQWCEECEPDLVASIAAQLPSLESLTLVMSPPGLPLLAPLRSTLTALDVMFLHPPAVGAGAEALSTLSNLRSLAVSATPRGRSSEVNWQHLLLNLPQLERLSWFAHSAAWTPQWLAGLGASAPQLTSLCLGYIVASQRAWDGCATAAVRQALSGLRSLSLRAVCLCEGAAGDPTVQALAQCTRLEAVHLHLYEGRSDVTPSLLQLSSLRLASLDLLMACSRGQGWLVAALPALTHLTKLQLHYNGCCDDSDALQLPSSLVELQLARYWKPSSLLPPLLALPSLRTLRLHHGYDARWSPAAAEQLSKLTQLRSLSIATACSQLLVPHLSGLTALRELRLEETSIMSPNITDQDLEHLAPLRELTRLAFNRMLRVTPSGLLPLLEALPNLQQLELSAMLRFEGGGGALVGGLLPLLPLLPLLEDLPNLQQPKLANWPRFEGGGEALVGGLLPRVLPRLTFLKLVGVTLPGHARDALLSAAEVHDCRCIVASRA